MQPIKLILLFCLLSGFVSTTAPLFAQEKGKGDLEDFADDFGDEEPDSDSDAEEAGRFFLWLFFESFSEYQQSTSLYCRGQCRNFIWPICCASVPIMPENLDRIGKSFNPPPNKANLYIVRPGSVLGAGGLYQVIVDGKIQGAVASSTYILLELKPGTHTISVIDGSSGFVTLAAIAGENYFVEVKATWGWFSGGISVKKLKELDGRNRSFIEAGSLPRAS